VADLAVLEGAPCTLSDNDWYANGPGVVAASSCGLPSIALVTFSCVHEHVDRALACAACAAELQRAADLLVCEHCEDDPQQPHECEAVIRIEWLTGAGER
jgi:hypothetical protein